MAFFSAFVLHGELEKEYRGINLSPDFVFHIPGIDSNNLAVIQVKRADAKFSEIIDDLTKLGRFGQDPLRYNIGILLLIGMQPKLDLVYTRVFDEMREQESKAFLISYDIDSGYVDTICQPPE